MKTRIYLALAACMLYAGASLAQNQTPVTWTSLVGVVTGTNTLTKNVATNTTAGAASVEVLPAGVNGWVETEVNQSGYFRSIGLSQSNTDATSGTINYSIQLRDNNNNVRVFENGTDRGYMHNYVIGDKYRVERVGTTIYYKRNGTTFYTSTVASSTSLLVDVSFYNNGGILYNTQVSFGAITTPSGLSASAASGSQINLSWTDNSNNETGFEIERSTTSGSGYALVTTTGAGATSYSDGSLSSGTPYYYRIRAKNGGMYSSYTAEASATTSSSAPTAPSLLSATVASSTAINLAWTDNSSNETGFQIERSLSTGTGFTLIHTTASNAGSYVDVFLTANTTYYYRIRATNGGGNSAYTSEASATTLPLAPSAPSGLAASTASSTSINISWTDASSNETGFEIERSTTSGTGYTLIHTTAPNSNSYVNTTLNPSTTYYYRVRAINSGGNSGYTTEASATTSSSSGINAPSGLSATTVSFNTINISWTDNSNNETGFQIERSLTASSGFALVNVVGTNIVTYSDASLTANTTYYYRVRSVNTGANSSYSAEASATTSAVTLVAPSNLVATTSTSTSIEINWADNSDNEDGFQVERSLNSSSDFNLIFTSAEDVEFYLDDELSSNTVYYYRVRAVNEFTSSAYTAVASANTSIQPVAPSDFAAYDVSSGSVSLSWADNSNNETGFKIERSRTSGMDYSLIVTTEDDAVSFIDDELLPGTTYFYRIQAFNATGNSSYTTEINVTTTVGAPSGPAGFEVTITSPTSATLAWTDNSTNEVEFEIERSIISGSGFSLVTTVSADEESYVDENLTPGATYYYRIRTTNSGGSSSYSPEAGIRLPLSNANGQCENIYCDPNSGGIGIGTSDVPEGFKMAVNGKIMAEGVKVLLQANWPDYVFAPGYNLTDIPSLEKFIKENGHLPNVPSASTVEKEGIDIEAINIILLEKIEELSLHLIQMEERMRALEEENKQLKNKKEKKTK